MPPADSNTPDPAPAPVPEPPKKPGFFARLFGKKQADTSVVSPERQSQTPPPQLDDAEGTVKTDETAAPSGEGEATPPTLDVPTEVEGTPVPENDGVAPTLPVEGDVPSDGAPVDEEEKKEETTPPAGPVSPSV